MVRILQLDALLILGLLALGTDSKALRCKSNNHGLGHGGHWDGQEHPDKVLCCQWKDRREDGPKVCRLILRGEHCPNAAPFPAASSKPHGQRPHRPSHGGPRPSDDHAHSTRTAKPSKYPSGSIVPPSLSLSHPSAPAPSSGGHGKCKRVGKRCNLSRPGVCCSETCGQNEAYTPGGRKPEFVCLPPVSSTGVPPPTYSSAHGSSTASGSSFLSSSPGSHPSAPSSISQTPSAPQVSPTGQQPASPYPSASSSATESSSALSSSVGILPSSSDTSSGSASASLSGSQTSSEPPSVSASSSGHSSSTISAPASASPSGSAPPDPSSVSPSSGLPSPADTASSSASASPSPPTSSESFIVSASPTPTASPTLPICIPNDSICVPGGAELCCSGSCVEVVRSVTTTLIPYKRDLYKRITPTPVPIPPEAPVYRCAATIPPSSTAGSDSSSLVQSSQSVAESPSASESASVSESASSTASSVPSGSSIPSSTVESHRPSSVASTSSSVAPPSSSIASPSSSVASPSSSVAGPSDSAGPLPGPTSSDAASSTAAPSPLEPSSSGPAASSSTPAGSPSSEPVSSTIPSSTEPASSVVPSPSSTSSAPIHSITQAVMNSGFESSDSWILAGGNINAEQSGFVSNNQYTGSRAYKMQAISVGSPFIPILSQTLSVYPGSRYAVMLHIKQEKSDDCIGYVSFGAAEVITDFIPTMEYAAYTGEVTTAAGQTSLSGTLRIDFFCSNGGPASIVYVDDVTMTLIDN